MLRRLFRVAKALALFSSALSAIALAQKQVAPVRTQTPTVPAALSRFQTPAQRSLLPFVKAHPMQATNNGLLSPDGQSNYVTSPNFGGYVNAPLYNARTTASLDTGSFNNGVTVELTADFNKDGKPDIAVLQQDGTMNILLNNLNGGLSAPVSYYNPNYLTSSVNTAYAVDVNGDGFADIIGFDINNDTMITWLNLGNGTFNAAVTTPLDATYGYPNFVLVQDVNGDGKPDLIFAMSQFVSRSSANIFLEVMPGKGDGTFITPVAAQVQEFAVAASVQMPGSGGIALGDLNGDGKLDIAVAIDERLSAATGEYVVTTALGNGDGTFGALGKTLPVSVAATSPNGFTVAYNSTGVQLVDLNGDGKLDLATDINGTLVVAPGQGSGTFGAALSTSIPQASGLQQMIFTDVNGDGKPDLIAGAATLAIFQGNGDGTFAAPTTSGQYIADPTSGIALADFNGDGIADIAQLGADYKEVALYFGNGKGELHGAPLVTSASDTDGVDWNLEATGKYTTSGFSDAVFLHVIATGTELLTGISDGKGNFTFVSSLAGGVPSDLQYIQPIHADFNGDGNEDLLLTGLAGNVTVALSHGDGTFAAPVSVYLPAGLACPVYYAAAGDLDGDGKTDLIIPYAGDQACGSAAGGPSGFYTLLGKGDGTFSAPVFTQAGTELYSATLADINGDGKLDLVLDDAPLVTGVGFNISLALGNGDGTFGTLNTILTNYLISDVAVGDINGDGKADLVLSAEEVEGSVVTTGGILTITGNGDGTFNSPSLIASGNFFYGMQLADMSNDGNPDIVATLYSTNGQPKNYYGMVTLLGLGNGQFTAPVNQLESLASTLPQVGNFYNDNALDVMTQTGYGPALFMGQGGTSLALTASVSSAVFGSTETFTATVTDSITTRPASTGPVSFYDGTTLLGQADLTNGTATLTTASLAIGTHNVNATYAGDANSNPATASPVAVTISTLAPSFTLTGTPSTLSIASGANGVVSLTLAANATFSGAVNLSCSGAPAKASCVVNQPSVTLTAGQSATATLVIGTTSANAELHPASSPWGSTSAMAGLAVLFGIYFGRRKRVRMLTLLSLGLMVSLGTFLTGCNGGGTTAPAIGPTSFTVTVTATPASGSTASPQTTTVNITVN
jgi:hypothetical protein